MKLPRCIEVELNAKPSNNTGISSRVAEGVIEICSIFLQVCLFYDW